jgi:hypothetical protein
MEKKTEKNRKKNQKKKEAKKTSNGISDQNGNSGKLEREGQDGEGDSNFFLK